MSVIKKSFVWSAVESVIPRLIHLTTSIILARMLAPSEFGLIGMLAIFIGVATVLAESGLSASIIQKETITKNDETSVFVMNIILGAVMTLILCAISPLVSIFYKEKELTALLCASSLAIFISSFAMIQKALLTRAMKFKQMAIITLVTTIVSAGTGLTMANLGYGVWGLVGMTISGSIANLVMYWLLGNWRLTGAMKLANIRNIWEFSSYFLYSQLIGIGYQNMYSVIIGKQYSAEALGYYNRANNLHMLPAGLVSNMIGKVAFPLFSKFQNDKVLLLNRLRQLIRISVMLSSSGMILLAIIADPLVPFLLTDRWMSVVPLLRILCYSALLFPISALFLMALQAQGYSKLCFKLEIIKVCVGLILVLSVAHLGLIMLTWCVVIIRAIAYFINVWHHVQNLKYKWSSQMYDILPTYMLCGVAALLTIQLPAAEFQSPISFMIARSAIFIAIVSCGIVLLKRSFFADMWDQCYKLIAMVFTKPRISIN